MVIDFHTHIYPDKIAPKAVMNIGAFYTIPVRCDGTVQGLLESGTGRLGGSGIDRFVVFSAAGSPKQVSGINTYIASVCEARRECIGFGALHRDMQNPGDEIERIIRLGLRGIKFHPDMQRFNIDDEKMTGIYAALEGRLPVVFHCGDYRYTYSHPARLAKVLNNFPKLTAVAAHFGGWSVFDLALEYLGGCSCYLDVSSSIPFLGARRAEELIRIYGAERILFGSDYPMWNPSACLEEVRSLNLPEGDKELILCQNALRILGQDA